MNAPIKSQFHALVQSSALSGANGLYLEDLYETFLADPLKVDAQWRRWFEGLQSGASGSEVIRSQVREEFRQLVRQKPTSIATPPPDTSAQFNKQVRVLQLINAYRFVGHRASKINPLDYKESAYVDDLDPATHELSDADLETEFNGGSLVGAKHASLREILRIVKSTYCGSVGAEYMHITETKEKRWIQNYLESVRGQPEFPADKKRQTLRHLIGAEGLERFLHTKYIGQKRFSLEGAESLIPLLSEIVHRAGKQGVEECAIGMAHRGRLNVLINLMGKTPADLFQEFEGKVSLGFNGTGDVKYHLGFSSDLQTSGGPVHIALAFNPSHLEIVGPVVEGSVRARQERRNDTLGSKVIPVLIHGDAAFAAQGVVMETFNMSQSRGFSTKGTVHVVINNQIGYTTSNQEDARSTLYCTDVAKMVGAPIFHVNGDDPEAVVFVSQLALDYRMTFYKDVVIDLVCYRRHGHSEADEPMATQPLMYRAIRQKTTTLGLYAQKLIEESVLTESDYLKQTEDYRAQLSAGLCVVEHSIPPGDVRYPYDEDWDPFQVRACSVPVDTKVTLEILTDLYARVEKLPPGFELHPNVAKIYENRRRMMLGEIAFDWGFAETLAYASLLNEGYAVRLSGQDSGRGTFFHRHAVVHSQTDGQVYVPLRNLSPSQPNFLVINSLLSEEAVLAFEYGYSTTDPHTLTIWEAQFGDFANTAQVVVDQFISAGEQKWNRLCGLVMFLPHGYEGQGPEHSSARLERYLQLCAQQNIQVCVPTTAAQIFHLLRRQMLMTCRKPLVVMTPKSLLRHKDASSSLQELVEGRWRRIIPPGREIDAAKVRRVVLCSGKVYYDLAQKQRVDQRDDVAIIRIEQLYPFPEKLLAQELTRFPNVAKFVWCQEEPMNQGAWYSSQHRMRAAIGKKYKLKYAGRPRSAAPAVGLYSLHTEQLKKLLDDALG